MGAGEARSPPTHLYFPTASLSGTIWGTGWAVALPGPGHCGHQFSDLVPQICVTLLWVSGHGCPTPYLYMVSSFSLSTLWAAIIN